ncbi:hypothetical protein YIM_29290 [Amycolatopsis sp. YIM 10]|nr:hypothetical protein YIM_29290 [Amycolatopsis sp. YIM 10]
MTIDDTSISEGAPTPLDLINCYRDSQAALTAS